MQTSKTKAQKATKTPRHSTRRALRGRDRRAERRTERDFLVLILHPALFEQLVAA